MFFVLLSSLIVCCFAAKYDVTYSELIYPSAYNQNSTYLTGVRHVEGEDLKTVYISANALAPIGTSNMTSIAAVYYGSIDTLDGEWFTFQMPSSTNNTVTGTYFYGPNSGESTGTIQAAGAYSNVQNGINELGLLYQGGLDGSGTYTTLHPQELDSQHTVFQTAAHSTMGGLVVGNFYTFIVASRAFIYDISANQYDELHYPNADSISLYGIWHDSGDDYTLTGGINGLELRSDSKDYSFVCKWNSTLRNASNWMFFEHSANANWTHFEGIYGNNGTISDSAIGPYAYTYVSDWQLTGHTDTWYSSFVVMRNYSGDSDSVGEDGSNGVNATETRTRRVLTRDLSTLPSDEASTLTSSSYDGLEWVDYWYPNSINNSANTIYMNYAIGKFVYPDSRSISRGYIAVFTLASDDDGTTSSSSSTDGEEVVVVASVLSVVVVLVLVGVFGRKIWLRFAGGADADDDKLLKSDHRASNDSSTSTGFKPSIQL